MRLLRSAVALFALVGFLFVAGETALAVRLWLADRKEG
jgi:hypothetical protein